MANKFRRSGFETPLGRPRRKRSGSRILLKETFHNLRITYIVLALIEAGMAASHRKWPQVENQRDWEHLWVVV